MIVLLTVLLFIKYSTSFPERLQEIFTLDCQRRAHILPQLPWATGIDLSGYLAIMNVALNEMYEQSKVVCPDITDEEFNHRFGLTLPQGFVRMFELEKFPPNECEDRYYQEISTYYHYIKGLLPEDPLPDTCSQEAADEGRCHFALELNAFTLQFAIEECPTYPGEDIYNRIPFLSITCEGCDTFMKPCTANDDCGDDMLCELYEESYGRFYAWFKNTTLGGEFVLDEQDFFDFGWFDDLLKKSVKGYEFVTEFFHSVAWNYWGSGFTGHYDLYQFCFPDISYGSDLFLGLYDIEECDDSPVIEEFYCDGVLFTAEDVCSGYGECVDYNLCVCEEGWKGQICEIPVMDHTFCYGKWSERKVACSGHGTCVAEDVCVCKDGWMGDMCERVAQCGGIDYYEEEACGSHGVCVSDEVCECEDFWFTLDDNNVCGEELECGVSPYYFTGPYGCSYNGICRYVDEASGAVGECECDHGYEGPNCAQTLMCDDVEFYKEEVCSGNGNCTNDGCLCYPGYEDTLVDGTLTPCHSDERKCGSDYFYETGVCSSHGVCQPNPDTLSYECDCFHGWVTSNPDNENSQCNAKLACYNVFFDLNPCSGHGTCVEGVDGDGICECDTYWEGLECDSQIFCNDIFGGDEGVCSGNGICTIDAVCVCDQTHYGDDCQYLKECGGYRPNDPLVCEGTGVCTVDGCEMMEEVWFPEEDPEQGESNQECTAQVLHIFSPWEGNLQSGKIVNSESRKNGQVFTTQINRIRMEYDPEKPVPIFVYNGDGVFTFLPTHKFFGFAVYFKELDRLLVLMNELFQSLREFHSDITDVIQEYYYKIWDPLPWLFRFTSYNVENHLNWRVSHWDRRIVRFLKGYRLPDWFKLIEPPMTCTLQTYRDTGNCTIRFTSLKKFFGEQFDVYVRFQRDEKNSATDYTGFPHMEVWCDGVLCHELYSLKRCEDNLDCASEHCRTWLQTYDYRDDNFVTPVPVFEIVEEDGTTFTYDALTLNALFFEGSYFRMDFSADALRPLDFFKKMHAKVTGIEYEEDTEEDINFCLVDRKEDMRVRRGKYRHFWGSFWTKLGRYFDKLYQYENVDNWWQNHLGWWKNGGWWNDNDDDDEDDWDWNWGGNDNDDDDSDEDDNDDGDDWDWNWDWDWDWRRQASQRRGWWKNWWKKKWKKKKKWVDRELVMKVEGLEAWNTLFCMKQGGDECGCEEGMVNCVCYELADTDCEHYFDTPQAMIEILPEIEYVPPPPPPDEDDDNDDDSTDDDADDSSDDDDQTMPPNSLNPNSSSVLAICGLVFGLALFF